MVNKVLLRKQLRDLAGRKGAILALVMILAVGVGGFTGFLSVWHDMDGARNRYYARCRLADFFVDCKRAPVSQRQHIADLAAVGSVRGRVKAAVMLRLSGQEVPISGTAFSLPLKRRPVLNDVMLRTGSWFSERDKKEVLLTHAFAEANGLKAGDRIRCLLHEEMVELLVVGTVMSPEFVYLIPPQGGLAPDPARFAVMYCEETFLQERADLEGAYNQFIGTLHRASPESLHITCESVEAMLEPFGVTHAASFEDTASVRFLSDEIHGLKISAVVVPGIFLCVAVLVLNIMMARLVVQQRTVIGTLKALGYSRLRVTFHFLSYGMVIGALGGGGGLLFGRWIQVMMVMVYRQFYNLPAFEAQLYPGYLGWGLLISIFSSAFGTLKGIRYVVLLQPAEAMRPPPPEKGASVLPEYVPFFWNRLPFRWKMIFRAVFRNPYRSAVSIFSSVIATAIVVMAIVNIDALNYLMAYEFDKVSHQDLTVSLREPASRRSLQEVKSLPGVGRAEPQLIVPCELSNGAFEKRIGITGIPETHRLYTPLTSDGKEVVIPGSGLVLSRKLAEILHASPGDSLRMRVLIAERQERLVPVTAIVDTYLGLSAYADLRYLSRLTGERYCANTLLVDLFPAQAPDRLYRELMRRPEVAGVNERSRLFQQLDETFGRTMGTMISIMILLAGVIAFGSVLNTALVSLSERRRDVGTLRVLGYAPYEVWLLFSGETFLLNVIGITAGLAAGIGCAWLLAAAYNTELYRFPVVIYPSRLVISAFLMAVFVVIAQLVVLRLVKKVHWLEVLGVKE